MTTMGRHRRDDPSGLAHVALLHAGDQEFVEGAVAHLREGLLRDEPAIAALSPHHTAVLRDALGDDADRVVHFDMSEIGRNPGRLIPALHGVLGEFGGRGRLHLVSGSVWAGRTAGEQAAAVQGEALVNLAVPDASVSLLCPYDTRRLDPDTITLALAAHPAVQQGDKTVDSPTYDALGAAEAAIGTLEEPAEVLSEALVFDAPDGPRVTRHAVAEHALRAGLDAERTADLCLAVHELAVNTLMHTRAPGILTFWTDEDGVACEVQDSGWIRDPLAGRHPVGPADGHGYGLYLVHQVCDLVRVRTGPDGTTVRVSMRLP